MKGGYVMIDCKGLSVDSESAVTVSGLGNSLGKALLRNKPIMLYNLSKATGLSGTTPLTPVSAACAKLATSPAVVYAISIPGFGLDSTIHLTVTGDSVTVTKTGTDEET